MKFRPHHLACLVLLLSSLSGAEASTLHTGRHSAGANYISVLLAHDQAAASAEAVLEPRIGDVAQLALPAGSLAQHRTPWTMRPPSAHSLQLQAATAFAI
jgi:hypothetical protein